MTLLDTILDRAEKEMKGPSPAMRRSIATAHTAAYYAALKERTGVMPKGLSKAERAELKARVGEQLGYYDTFAEASPDLSDAAVKSRAQMYAKAVKGTYYTGRYPGLPAYPCSGATKCLSNCLCSLDEREDGIHWVLNDGESCSDCQAMAAGGPYGTGD